MVQAPERPTPVIDLSASPVSPWQLVKQTWRARELMRILSRREFFIRYRRASFGVMWVVVLPLVQALVLAELFSHVTRFGSVHHYFAFVYAGMVAWTFYSVSVTTGSTSIVDGSQLSSKVYFPRVLLPLVTLGSNMYGLVVNVVLLLVTCLVSGVSLGPKLLMIVVALLALLAYTGSLCLLLAAAHVYFRDIRYVVQAAMLLLFYLTPIFYPISLAPHALRGVIWANPLTGVVALVRVATVGASQPLALSMYVTAGWTGVLAVLALWAHSKYDRLFADLM